MGRRVESSVAQKPREEETWKMRGDGQDEGSWKGRPKVRHWVQQHRPGRRQLHLIPGEKEASEDKFMVQKGREQQVQKHRSRGLMMRKGEIYEDSSKGEGDQKMLSLG